MKGGWGKCCHLLLNSFHSLLYLLKRKNLSDLSYLSMFYFSHIGKPIRTWNWPPEACFLKFLFSRYFLLRKDSNQKVQNMKLLILKCSGKLIWWLRKRNLCKEERQYEGLLWSYHWRYMKLFLKFLMSFFGCELRKKISRRSN